MTSEGRGLTEVKGEGFDCNVRGGKCVSPICFPFHHHTGNANAYESLTRSLSRAPFCHTSQRMERKRTAVKLRYSHKARARLSLPLIIYLINIRIVPIPQRSTR